MNIKIILDEENNIAYIYFDEDKKDKIFDTVQLDKYDMNVDVTKDGTVVGIELLNAKEQLKSFKSKKKMSVAFQSIPGMKVPRVFEMA